MSAFGPGAPPPRSWDVVFTRALTLKGAPYLEAEGELRGGGPGAMAFLRAAEQAHTSPALTRFVASVIADWTATPTDEFADAMVTLRELEESRRGKAASTPREDVVAQLLFEKYAGRIAGPVALRLLKEAWPPWKVKGCLIYLARVRVAATAPALARYAVTATLQRARELATEALTVIAGAPAVPALLDEARAWAPPPVP